LRARLDAVATDVDSLHSVAYFGDYVPASSARHLCGAADRARAAFHSFESALDAYALAVRLRVPSSSSSS